MADVDHIIHAGDIGGPEILHALEALAPTTAVLGNNDFDEYGSRVGRFAHPVIDGVRFLVAHYPRDVQIGFNGCAGLAAGDPIPQVCVHGHTHVPELVYGPEARPASYVVCPGAPFRPRGGFPKCTGRMLVDDGRVLGVRIASLDGRPCSRWARARKAKARAFHAHWSPEGLVFRRDSAGFQGDNACEPSMFSCKRVL